MNDIDENDNEQSINTTNNECKFSFFLQRKFFLFKNIF